MVDIRLSNILGQTYVHHEPVFADLDRHMSTDGTKSVLGWLTARESAVFADGFGQSEGGGLLPPHFEKIKCRGYDHGRGS